MDRLSNTLVGAGNGAQRLVIRTERNGICPHAVRKHELSIQNGCVLWGVRVIVPKPGQENVLRQFHQCHLGVSRMKALARSYIWWPKLDKEVEDTVKA